MKATKMAFMAKSTVKFFSNVVFLVVTIGGYPGMVPICQPNFEITTDISSDLCLVSNMDEKY